MRSGVWTSMTKKGKAKPRCVGCYRLHPLKEGNHPSMEQLVKHHRVGARHIMTKTKGIQFRIFLPNGRTLVLNQEQAKRILNALERGFADIEEESRMLEADRDG